MTYYPPRSGQFRNTIRIERRSHVSDNMGGLLETWEIVASDISARVIASPGTESVRAMRLSGISPFDIALRWSALASGITAGNRAVDQNSGQIYNIKWAGCIDGKNRFIHLSCETGGLIDGS